MLPISTSDILKILEQIPLWKSVIALPKRLAELEARVAALENKGPTPKGAAPHLCPHCSIAMAFVSERDHPIFGDIGGVKIHTLRCETCGLQVEREYLPMS